MASEILVRSNRSRPMNSVPSPRRRRIPITLDEYRGNSSSDIDIVAFGISAQTPAA